VGGAVELRREESRRRPQDRIRPTQLAVLLLQLSQAGCVGGGRPGSVAGIDLGLGDPVAQGVGVDAELAGDALHRPGAGGGVAAGLDRHPDRAAHDLGVDTTATALLARLEQTPEQRRRGERLLRWSNAGHLPPLLINPHGAVRYLQAAPDLMLGVDPDTARHDHEELLEPGTTVLLYTDGLIERRDAPLQAGMDWLATTVTDLSDLPVDALLEELLALVGDQVEDDVALLAVRAYPEDEPRPREAGPGYDPREEPTAGGTAPA
jgi:hypothetical protein